MRPYRRTAILALLVTTTLTGCRTWTAVDRLPADLPDRTRVTTRAGERIEVAGGTVSGDTLLVGRLVGTTSPAAIRAEEIALVEVGRFSPERTLLAAAGIAVGIYAFLGILVALHASSWP